MTTDNTDPVLDPQLQARAERAAWWEETQDRRSRTIRQLCLQIAYLDLDDIHRPGMIRQFVDVATLYLDRVGQPPDLEDLTVLIPPDGIDPGLDELTPVTASSPEVAIALRNLQRQYADQVDRTWTTLLDDVTAAIPPDGIDP